MSSSSLTALIYDHSRSPSPACSESESGLYVPLHKRRASSVTRTDDPMSTASSGSSRPSSRAESHFDFAEMDRDAHPRVYSRDRLLALAKSPLAAMPKEVKDGLRERLPEIVMSRKHRKAMEYRALMQQRTQDQQHQQQQQQQPSGAPLHHPPQVQRQQHQQQQDNSHPHPHYHHHHYAPQKMQAQVQTQPQFSTSVPRPATWPSQPRPLGRAWLNAAKPAVDNMNWRKTAAPSSISVL